MSLQKVSDKIIKDLSGRPSWDSDMRFQVKRMRNTSWLRRCCNQLAIGCLSVLAQCDALTTHESSVERLDTQISVCDTISDRVAQGRLYACSQVFLRTVEVTIFDRPQQVPHVNFAQQSIETHSCSGTSKTDCGDRWVAAQKPSQQHLAEETSLLRDFRSPTVVARVLVQQE